MDMLGGQRLSLVDACHRLGNSGHGHDVRGHGDLVLNRGMNNGVILRLCARVALCALTWLT
jgi:hypothetical protein